MSDHCDACYDCYPNIHLNEIEVETCTEKYLEGIKIGYDYCVKKLNICDKCMKNDYKLLDNKHYVYIYNSGFYVDGKLFSMNKINRLLKKDEIYYCPGCNMYHYKSNRTVNTLIQGGVTIKLCDRGKELTTRPCPNCGKLMYYYDNRYCIRDEIYCQDCYEKISKYKIKNYHESVDLKWFTTKDGTNVATRRDTHIPYFGVELEVSGGGEDDNHSKEVIDLLKDEVYTMHDGSLEDGFEIITHPHTEESLYNLEYQKAFDYLTHNGYNSHNTSCCGLHVHIGREMFNDDKSLVKMLYFYENNKEDIIKISRRRFSSLCRWSAFYTDLDYKPTLEECWDIIDDYDKQGDHDMRYKAVNLQNSNTVEIRCMRGTLLLSTYLATLDFIITIAKNSNKIKLDEVNNIDLWLDGMKEDTLKYIAHVGAFGYKGDIHE